MRLLVLDRYHLGDPLFPRQLARAVRGASAPLLVVHDSGAEGEQALEATGAPAGRRDGVLPVETPELRALVERAVRETNRTLVHELNEEGVPALRVFGTDRGLLRREDGALRTGRVGWLADLAAQGALPVVGGLVDARNGPVEVDAATAAVTLAAALEGADVVFLARDTRAGLRRDGTPPDALPASALTERDVPGVEAVRRALAGGARVFVAPLGALGGAARTPGVRVATG